MGEYKFKGAFNFPFKLYQGISKLATRLWCLVTETTVQKLCGKFDEFVESATQSKRHRLISFNHNS